MNEIMAGIMRGGVESVAVASARLLYYCWTLAMISQLFRIRVISLSYREYEEIVRYYVMLFKK